MTRRRQVLLMFKEMLHNIVRHAHAKRVEIRLRDEGGKLRLTVEDDGVGFRPAEVAAGHGLGNMKARARGLGATLQLASEPGRGTRVDVVFDARPPLV